MIKLSEAIHKMNPGDLFDCPELDKVSPFLMNGNRVIKNKLGDYIAFNVANMNMEGEIIRAEPEVLTVGEIIDKNSKTFNNEWAKTNPLDFAVMCSNQADKNGQIKEWKRLKHFIDTVEKYRCGSNRASADDLYRALENLTPPWETEK